MASDDVAVQVDDRPGSVVDALAPQEGPVVVSGEKAGLLALAAIRDRQPGLPRLGAGLILRLVAERQPETLDEAWVEAAEHVRLVLRGVRRPCEQRSPAMLHDPRVVTRGESRCSDPAREREERRKAERTVAADAGVRRLTPRIRGYERRDDCSPELLALVERDVRDTETMAELPRRDHRLRRATGAIGIWSGRIEPQPQRDPDRIQAMIPHLQQGDGAVDAAAHRDGDAPVRCGRADRRAERIRERIGREPATRNRGRSQHARARTPRPQAL